MKSGAIVVFLDEDGEVRPQMVQIAIRGRVDLLPLQRFHKTLAAVYIKSRMSAYGLEPLNGDGFQRFKVTEKIMPGKKNSITTGRSSFNSNNEVAPLSFSENGKVSAEVVFAGYGFSINNDSTNWDDYKGLDVKNKWVMVLRADPEPDNARSRYASFSADRVKALVAGT